MTTLDTLLGPVSAASACGENLSFSAEFDTIRELQREDDPTLDQGEWIQPLKAADWHAVQAQCEKLLTQRSKDLRLVIWLAEAYARNAGAAGLRQGLALCTRLCEQFWAELHPLPEDGSQDERTGNIQWFLQRIGLLVGLCPITAADGGRGHGYALQDWVQARAPGHGATPAPTQDQILKALKETPAQQVVDTHDALQQCLDMLVRWQRCIDAELGADGPSFVGAREALETACHHVRRLGTEIGLWQAEATAPAPVASVAAPVVPAAMAVSRHGPIETAEQALAQLREVAAFYRRTQPHSPVAYLAEKAAHWGEMPLHDWLRAVVKDGGTLASLEELLGVSAGVPSR